MEAAGYNLPASRRKLQFYFIGNFYLPAKAFGVKHEVVYLLIILVMNIRQGPLLRIPLHLVSSSGHQAVHHIQRIVAHTLQDKPEDDNDED